MSLKLRCVYTLKTYSQIIKNFFNFLILCSFEPPKNISLAKNQILYSNFDLFACFFQTKSGLSV